MTGDSERLAISLLYSLGVAAVIVLLFELLEVFPPIPEPIGPTEVVVELNFPIPADRISEEPRRDPTPQPEPVEPSPTVPEAATPQPVTPEPVVASQPAPVETVRAEPDPVIVPEPVREEPVAETPEPAVEEPAEEPLSFDQSALDQAFAQSGASAEDAEDSESGAEVVQNDGIVVAFQAGADTRTLLSKPKPDLPTDAFSDARPVIYVSVDCIITQLGRIQVQKIQSTGQTRVDQVIIDTLEEKWRFASISDNIDIRATIQFEIRAQ